MNKRIVLKGMLRTTTVFFNDDTAEISIFGDITVCRHSSSVDMSFENLPLVRILVERNWADEEVEIVCEYCIAVPRLHVIKSFRLQLEVTLRQFIESNVGLSSAGALKYLQQLMGFSESAVLKRELLSCVNNLDPSRVDVNILRRALNILGRTSDIDNQFEVTID